MDTMPSIVRTIVPLVVSALVTFAARYGVGIDDVALTQVIGAVVAAGYYAAVRYLETHHAAAWGWLLGLAKAPSYTPAPTAPTGPTGPYTADLPAHDWSGMTHGVTVLTRRADLVEYLPTPRALLIDELLADDDVAPH